jgi:hypothetical protein
MEDLREADIEETPFAAAVDTALGGACRWSGRAGAICGEVGGNEGGADRSASSIG